MIQRIRGFRDILPGESDLWQFVERTAAGLFADFGYREIRIPIMERTELFARSIGEDTDIVAKEMYTFIDRGGEMLTLRPEATAAVVRAYIQHGLHAGDPVQKFYTVGPMFRRERPQKGRYRQFYQINVEAFGIAEPYIDAQLIHMLAVLCRRLEVTDVAAHINSLGCPECRPVYRRSLIDFTADRVDRLCADCRRRRTRNPLRVLDCKVPGCREAMADAPALLDSLCPECRRHFDAVRGLLDRLAVPYRIDKRLVRGLDYYTRTTFEIQTGALGAQSAVAGGGRYDGLVKLLGGPDLPAIGFAIGFDRLAEIVGQQHPAPPKPPALFVAALGEACRQRAFEWVAAWASSGLAAEMEMKPRSLKAQMKRADRLGAGRVLIVGDSEMEKGLAVLRDMHTRAQRELPIEGLVERVRDIVERKE